MKEKVIIWGTGEVFQARLSVVKGLVEEGVAEIIALVSRDASERMLEGYPIVRKEDVPQLQYDRIVIAAAAPAKQSIIKDIQALGLGGVIQLHPWIIEKTLASKDCYQKILNVQGAVLEELLTATDEQVRDFHWMRERVCRYGIYPFRTQEKAFYTEFGIMQIVDEYTRYCNFISGLEVKRAIEIGVYRGRSAYFVCALLSRKTPDMTYDCVDIHDYLDSFSYFKKLLPALNKRVPSVADDYVGEAFDYVFIDADHSYDASLKDYLNCGQYAKKLVAFHDIYAHEYDGENGGTVRMWKEVMRMTEGKEHKIFSEYPDEWMGIGCVLM